MSPQQSPEAPDPAFYPREECGIVGVYRSIYAANLVYLGLHALQHRGQESSGIVSSDGENLYRFTGMGMVSSVFTPDNLDKLQGNMAIGHNRYSTTGGKFLRNAQPLRAHSSIGPIALAHNGNLINTWELREQLEASGSIFQTSIDSEVMVHLMARSGRKNFDEALFYALRQIKGAFSLLVLNQNEMFVVRDPNGFRPLCLGVIEHQDGLSPVAASETCAFDIIMADYERDIEPGEVLKITKNGKESYYPWARKNWSFPLKPGRRDKPGALDPDNPKDRKKLRKHQEDGAARQSMCIFEFIYFSRPDSRIFNQSVYKVRKKLGAILAEESPVEADVVIPVPDSANVAALGYAEQSGIPYDVGLIRSHYVGRTFIEPDQKIRDFGAKLKFNAVRGVLRDKRVVVVDDSIMRGTTSRKIIKMVRQAGAREVHLRISAPPTKFPCYYGIDIPTKSELIASTHTLDEIRKYLRVDSIAYLSVEGMLKAGESRHNNQWCVACFDGNYPLEFPGMGQDRQKDLFDDLHASD